MGVVLLDILINLKAIDVYDNILYICKVSYILMQVVFLLADSYE